MKQLNIAWGWSLGKSQSIPKGVRSLGFSADLNLLENQWLIPHRLARVMQFGMTVQFGKSLIISLWFDPVDCNDYPCRGYHVISCVNLLFANYLPAEVREEGTIQLGGGYYEKNKDFVLGLSYSTQRSQEVLVDIPERITEHGLSSEINQSSGGSSDTSEGSENSGSFEDYGSSCEGLML
ncbi:hypothetical protein Tco_1451254 [Tanacetum coccineum]